MGGVEGGSGRSLPKEVGKKQIREQGRRSPAKFQKKLKGK
jgi:hypothetical protein